MPASRAELIDLTSQILRVDADRLSPDTRFDDLGRTSFAELELFTGIEDRFGVTLDFRAYSKLQTIGALTDAVEAAAHPTDRDRASDNDQAA
jgi:acyl carrier protein